MGVINDDSKTVLELALEKPYLLQREMNNRSFYQFLLCFWDVISSEPLVDNWHIEFICNELQQVAERVGNREAKEYDLIINVPPGTSKTSICLRLFPAWVWSKWYDIKFITGSYSSALALDSAEDCRELIRSDLFKQIYPEIQIKEDKDTKSNYKIVKKSYSPKDDKVFTLIGGNRFSTSVLGSLTGFHAHILIWDDLLNPHEATSRTILDKTNYWLDNVSSTRKVDKEISVTIVIQQRVHQNDPTGHLLSKGKGNIKHICLPGELGAYTKYVKPAELALNYVDGLLDPNRLSRAVLKEMEQDLGQYGYAGQVGQNPVQPSGGMFKVDKFQIIHELPMPHEIESHKVRFWDKAGTKDGGAYTAGVKMYKLTNGKYVVVDVVRGQWSTDEREKKIKATTEADGKGVTQWIEQEPGSGGKESAENTIKNLAGYIIKAEAPKGDKVYRADPYSVQVNWGNVYLLHGDWNHDFIEEHRFFPFGKFKDQVDGAGAGFAKLAGKKKVKSW